MSPRRAAGLDPDLVPRRAAATYTVELDGDAIVLDEVRNRLHLLNASAALVWSCFDGTATLADIAGHLADATGTPIRAMLDDIVAITHRLGAEGLLEGLPGGPPG